MLCVSGRANGARDTYKEIAAGAGVDIAEDSTTVTFSARLKSGSVSVTEDSFQAVSFTTAFASAPNVAVSVEETSPEHYVSVGSITTSGFTIYLDKPGGGPAGSVTVHWIATDAGNV